MHSEIEHWFNESSYSVFDSFVFIPVAVVAFAWGSRSKSKTFLFVAARLAERLIAVVVLPTPPF